MENELYKLVEASVDRFRNRVVDGSGLTIDWNGPDDECMFCVVLSKHSRMIEAYSIGNIKDVIYMNESLGKHREGGWKCASCKKDESRGTVRWVLMLALEKFDERVNNESLKITVLSGNDPWRCFYLVNLCQNSTGDVLHSYFISSVADVIKMRESLISEDNTIMKTFARIIGRPDGKRSFKSRSRRDRSRSPM